MAREADNDKLTETAPSGGGGGQDERQALLDYFLNLAPYGGFGMGWYGGGSLPGGGGGGGTAAAAPSVLDRILKWLRPGLVGASLLGGATANRGGQQIPPELQRILDLQAQRMEAQGPLFEATAQTAFNRLPTYATEGFAPPSLATAAGQVPPSTPDPNTPPGLQSLLRQQEIRMRTGDPILQAIQRLAQMRLPTGP